MLAYAAVVVETEHNTDWLLWLLPNYQQNSFNATVTSFLISASSLLRLRIYSLSNFSINMNIFLLLLSCCKSLDFTSFSFYIQHIKIFHSHQLRAWVLQQPLMRH